MLSVPLQSTPGPASATSPTLTTAPPLGPRLDVYGQPRPLPIGARARATIQSVDHRATDTLAASVAGVAVAIVLGTGVAASFLVAQVQGEVDRARSQLEALTGQLASGPAAESLTRIRTVASQVAASQQLRAASDGWPALVDRLAAAVPGSIKLGTVSFNTQSAVQVTGEAASYADVGRFIVALEQAEEFDQPTLTSVSYTSALEGSRVNFTLSAPYHLPTPSPASAASAPADSASQPAEGGSTQGAGQ